VVIDYLDGELLIKPIKIKWTHRKRRGRRFNGSWKRSNHWITLF